MPIVRLRICSSDQTESVDNQVEEIDEVSDSDVPDLIDSQDNIEN